MNNFLRTETMRILQAHRGRDNAMPRDRLMERLKLFNPDLNDRDFRKLYVGLPIATCAEGLFLPQTATEVRDFKAYITKQSGPIIASRRVGTILAFYPQLAPPVEQLGLFQ